MYQNIVGSRIAKRSVELSDMHASDFICKFQSRKGISLY